MIQNSNSVGLLYNNSKIRKFCFASDLAGMTVLLQNDTSQDKNEQNCICGKQILFDC